MALYEYKCKSCKHNDLHQGFNGPPEEPKCTMCGSFRLERVYSFSTTDMPTQGGRKMGRK